MDSQQVFVLTQTPTESSVPSANVTMPLHPVGTPMTPKCAICGTTQKLLRCAKCKTIYYCSTDHQHLDWPTHKQECRQLAKQRQINGRDKSLQQLTNGCSAININSNSNCNSNSCSSLLPSGGNWPVNHGFLQNSHHSIQSPPPTQILGTNENEILNSKAETVTQNSNCDMYMSNFVANSTTSNQMHATHINANLVPSNTDSQQMVDNLGYYNHASVAQPYAQQQSSYSVSLDMQQQLHQPNMSQHQSFSVSRTQAYHPMPQLSNHLINQQEKSSSYQIGAAASANNSDENVMEGANERRYEELCRNIINDMNQYGLSVVDDFLGRDKGMQILNEVLKMYSAGVFKDGQLVNNLKSEQDLRTIRGDKITWVKGVEPGCSNVGYLINQIDAVICRANTMLNNGKLGNYVIKERTKAMVACYPGSGSHYVMHVDNPNKDGRVITAIYYLNVNWDSRDSGGVLRIFPEQAKSVADIEPKFDRLIFFWSDKRNPHEVQPAHRTRYAITVWYFDANEREAALNRCKNSQQNSNSKSTQSSTHSTVSEAPSIKPASETNNPHSSSSSSRTPNQNTSPSLSVASDPAALLPAPAACSSEESSARNATSASNVRPIQVVLPNCYK